MTSTKPTCSHSRLENTSSNDGKTNACARCCARYYSEQLLAQVYVFIIVQYFHIYYPRRAEQTSSHAFSLSLLSRDEHIFPVLPNILILNVFVFPPNSFKNTLIIPFFK